MNRSVPVPTRYFESFLPGEPERVGSHELTRREVVAFARRWDPQAMHTAPGAPVTACGSHLLAVCVRALVTHEPRPAVVAGVAWDEVRFARPAHPGTDLEIWRQCVEARPSRSDPSHGVVRNRVFLRETSGRILLSYLDTVLIERKCP